MNFTLRGRDVAVAVAMAAVVAVTGCSRTLTPASAFTADANSALGMTAVGVPASNTQPVYADQSGQPAEPYGEAAAGACAQPANGYGAPSYATRYGVRTVRVRAVEEQPRTYAVRHEVRHGRSTGKSVAIVAGSAGVGAAIGAIAGGGKGAAIGALAGGGGGFAYDRLTHNR